MRRQDNHKMPVYSHSLFSANLITATFGFSIQNWWLKQVPRKGHVLSLLSMFAAEPIWRIRHLLNAQEDDQNASVIKWHSRYILALTLLSTIPARSLQWALAVDVAKHVFWHVVDHHHVFNLGRVPLSRERTFLTKPGFKEIGGLYDPISDRKYLTNIEMRPLSYERLISKLTEYSTKIFSWHWNASCLHIYSAIAGFKFPNYFGH